MLDPKKVVSAHFEGSGTPENIWALRSQQWVSIFGAEGMAPAP